MQYTDKRRLHQVGGMPRANIIGLPKGPFGNMEYASNEIWNMEYEHEKGNAGHNPYMKSGLWDQENDPFGIWEEGK